MAETHIEKTVAQSLTLRSAVAIAIAFSAERLGYSFPDGAIQQVAAALIDLVATLGFIGVAIGRARARGPIQ